ncbi:TyeA family type III secretion system gatekeeper subunit [Endozoicomonas sp. OPT23]|uniref:TyeA family type III secretion system gatekeeper subunit n=1 Tax=Endozoicomonas sp. OPT23 TaxID=2072845 RepID=UPI00129BCDA3|nr:TyeA family type III secretion system gatekeeper subunit [Endozoicomonas sp. OPT23]MRI32160.1 TyeA family type III secretion system gatekeeper subunit [Endozoicomonas sp. OPT23]
MAASIEGAGSIQQPVFQDIPSDKGALGLKGRLSGENVVVKSDSQSALMDAAEELSMVANQFKSKKLDKRKMKSGSELSDKIMEKIKKIQTIQKTEAFKDTVNKFTDQKSLNQNQILKQARDFSGDPLEQYALLDFAQEYFAEQGDEEKANQIATAKKRIKDKNPTLITAGLNISEKVAQVIEEQGMNVDIRKVREGFAELVDESNLQAAGGHVQDYRTLTRTYNYLLGDLGASKTVSPIDKPDTEKKLQKLTSLEFEKRCQLLLEALGTELLALDKSASPERLQSIIQDMKLLKTLSGVHDLCCDTEDQMSRTYPSEQVLPSSLMGQVLKLVDQPWVTESEFENALHDLKVSGLEAKIFATRAMLDIIRSVPEEAFANDETKQNLMVSCQEHMDSLIEEEVASEIDTSGAELLSADNFVGEVTADLGLNKPPVKDTADFIIQKFLGNIAGESYQNPLDALLDVRHLASNPVELEKLLIEIPKLKDINPDFTQFADMAEQQVGDLLASVSPKVSGQQDTRQSETVRNG